MEKLDQSLSNHSPGFMDFERSHHWHQYSQGYTILKFPALQPSFLLSPPQLRPSLTPHSSSFIHTLYIYIYEYEHVIYLEVGCLCLVHSKPHENSKLKVIGKRLPVRGGKKHYIYNGNSSHEKNDYVNIKSQSKQFIFQGIEDSLYMKNCPTRRALHKR